MVRSLIIENSSGSSRLLLSDRGCDPRSGKGGHGGGDSANNNDSAVYESCDLCDGADD